MTAGTLLRCNKCHHGYLEGDTCKWCRRHPQWRRSGSVGSYVPRDGYFPEGYVPWRTRAHRALTNNSLSFYHYTAVLRSRLIIELQIPAKLVSIAIREYVKNEDIAEIGRIAREYRSGEYASQAHAIIEFVLEYEDRENAKYAARRPTQII